MNIFVTDKCPVKSANYLDDKRVVKMVLETAQLLSTVVYQMDPEHHANYQMYKPTHINHPCTVWAAESINNYHWLTEHFSALLERYTEIYNKEHACAKLEYAFILFSMKQLGGQLAEEPRWFVNCTRNKEHGIDYRYMSDVNMAYKLYLNDRWATDKRPVLFNKKSIAFRQASYKEQVI